MTMHFKPATRSETQIMLGIAGPSRSGKTYSALRIAMGMTGDDPSKIFVVDTESGRALQYVERFGQFMHLDLEAPFTPERYTEAIETAQKAGAKVIIVDSMSHVHEGPGGILEQHEQELQRMAGDDYRKREKMKFSAWIKPKQSSNRMVNRILQINCHMIFCFRAKDKLKMVKNAQGRQEPVSIGWQPICSDRFEYEMGAMLVLPEGAKGVPDFSANASGLREPFDKMIENGKQLDEELGRKLAEWSHGGQQDRGRAANEGEGRDNRKTEPSAPAQHPDEDADSRGQPVKGEQTESFLPEDDPDLMVIAGDIVRDIGRAENQKAAREILADYGLVGDEATGQLLDIKEAAPKGYSEILKAFKEKA